MDISIINKRDKGIVETTAQDDSRIHIHSVNYEELKKAKIGKMSRLKRIDGVIFHTRSIEIGNITITLYD